jgi:hypothetical protein
LNHIKPATAYADDVTIFLNSRQDVTPVTSALTEYIYASGAYINTNTSKALPLGEWDTSDNIYTKEYHRGIKIFGICFAAAIRGISASNWKPILQNIREVAQVLSIRNMYLIHKIWYAQTYVISKVWYTAQILPWKT